MFFRTFYRLDFISSEFNFDLQDLEFKFSVDLGDVCFYLEEVDSDISGKDTFLGVATVELQPPKSVLNVLERIRCRECRFSSPLQLVDEAGEFSQNINDMKGVTNLPGFQNIGSYSWIDEPFWDCTLDIKSSLDETCARLARLMCWRFGFVGRSSMRPSEISSYLWSMDAENWFQFPICGVFEDPYEFVPVVDNLGQSQIVEYLEKNAPSPLAVEIFQQAWSLREEYPQVSLVVAMSAVEVALKKFLAIYDSPKCKRLKLSQLLTRIEQPILVKGLSVTFPVGMVETIDAGRIIRNRLTHTEQQTVEIEKLQEILISVRDLLGLIDFWNGLTWARDFLSNEVKKYLDSDT